MKRSSNETLTITGGSENGRRQAGNIFLGEVSSETADLPALVCMVQSYNEWKVVLGACSRLEKQRRIPTQEVDNRNSPVTTATSIWKYRANCRRRDPISKSTSFPPQDLSTNIDHNDQQPRRWTDDGWMDKLRSPTIGLHTSPKL